MSATASAARCGSRGGALLLAAALAAGAPWPAPAAAHTVSADEVAAEVASPASRVAWGVVRAGPDRRLDRLLVVRVGARWGALPAAERRRVAEAWLARWRESVPAGIVAVLDDASDEPVVNYDAAGRARLLER